MFALLDSILLYSLHLSIFLFLPFERGTFNLHHSMLEILILIGAPSQKFTLSLRGDFKLGNFEYDESVTISATLKRWIKSISAQ